MEQGQEQVPMRGSFASIEDDEFLVGRNTRVWFVERGETMAMKRMFGCVVLLMGSAMTMVAAGQTSAPVKDDLFAGTEIFAKGASDVTEITMDPDTLGLVSGKDGKKAHNMILNVVRTYEYDKPGMYRIEDVDAFRNKLNTGDWHCSVHTRSLKTGESTDVCNKRRTDDLSETAIITVEPKELTFIHTIRKKGASESDVSGLPMMLGLPGLPGFTNLAMLDPDAFADLTALKMQMRMGKGEMFLDGKSFDFKMNRDMKNFPKLDSKEMKLKMDKAMKELNDAQGKMNLDLLTPEKPEAPEAPELAPMPPAPDMPELPAPPPPPARPEMPPMPPAPQP
jgi:hypothetical protein